MREANSGKQKEVGKDDGEEEGGGGKEEVKAKRV